jgi:hypothetical protein
LPVAAIVLVLAGSWNLSSHAWSFSRVNGDTAAHASYWRPAVGYLATNLKPSYRVEAVDTSGHWAAVYLPRAGIPLTRGWFRQDDFPQNEVLYDELDGPTYLHWLRRSGVRYVVLTDARVDYSAKDEARLIRSGRSGLHKVMHSGHITIYAVPKPRPMITGGAHAEVLDLAQTHMLVNVGSAGRYRLAIRYSPYWSAADACLTRGQDGMIRLWTHKPGRVLLNFKVNTGRALAVLVGTAKPDCPLPSGVRVAR